MTSIYYYYDIIHFTRSPISNTVFAGIHAHIYIIGSRMCAQSIIYNNNNKHQQHQ